MDLMQLLPMLMMMQGGNKQKAGKGGMDLPTMMQLMGMMGGGASPFGGGAPQGGGGSKASEPLNMDMSKLQGMLSPEMLALLSSLGRK